MKFFKASALPFKDSMQGLDMIFFLILFDIWYLSIAKLSQFHLVIYLQTYTGWLEIGCQYYDPALLHVNDLMDYLLI